MDDERLEHAHFLRDAERPRQALGVLASLLLDAPDDPDVRLLEAQCHRDLDNSEAALRAARRAVSIVPDDPVAQQMLGACRLDGEDVRGAIVAAREAVRLDPEDPQGQALLARARLCNQQWKTGLAAANRGLALDPDDAECLRLRAWALHGLDEHDGATQASAEALRLDPAEAVLLRTHGWTLLGAHRAREAEEAFRQALRIDPGHPNGKDGLSHALHERSLLGRALVRWLEPESGTLRKRVMLGAVALGLVLEGISTQWDYANVVVLSSWAAIITAAVLWVLTPHAQWYSRALLDAFLLRRREGRRLVTGIRRTVAVWTLASLLIGVLGMALVIRRVDVWSGLAAGIALLVVPIAAAGAFEVRRPKERRVAMTVAVVVQVLALGAAVWAWVDGPITAEDGGGRIEVFGAPLHYLFGLGVYLAVQFWSRRLSQWTR